MGRVVRMCSMGGLESGGQVGKRQSSIVGTEGQGQWAYVTLRVHTKLLLKIVFIQRVAQRVVSQQDRGSGHTWPVGLTNMLPKIVSIRSCPLRT